MLKIVLPWPSRDLSPNARVHWAVKSKAVKAAKEHAFWITKAQNVNFDKKSQLHVLIEFYPKSNKRQDIDNMLSMCKAYLDGISTALSVDDSKFELTLKRHNETRGEVIFTIAPPVNEG